MLGRPGINVLQDDGGGILRRCAVGDVIIKFRVVKALTADPGHDLVVVDDGTDDIASAESDADNRK